MNVAKIKAAVKKHRQLILDTERYIWAHPETGYKEWKTNEYLVNQFEKLGYKLERPENITGFTTTIDTGREGPTLLILGELDSVICEAHPESDKETGAVHSCGHNAQAAALVGIAAALTDKTLLEGLSGKIMLAAVPAEELLEIGYRQELMKKGVIRYFGGKSEFLSRGMFDGVDLAFMVHTNGAAGSRYQAVGCIAKQITYKGVASHAGGSPHRGVNALYAATNGLNVCNALRETFLEKDYIRFHPIITTGGQMVNAIPDTVVIESYVRGLTYEAIVRENKKLNRALIGSALSMGANIEIIDQPGYAPLKNACGMVDTVKEAYEAINPDEEFPIWTTIGTGSTDMGDLSTIMPVVHPYAPGAVGRSHGDNYYITDPEKACVNCAMWQIAAATLLLENEAERAKRIVEEYEPEFKSKEEFLDFQDSLFSSGDRIYYNGNEAVIKL